jgi:hypothetical protein
MIRYVDLTEAIDTGDASFLDTGDFNEADAIPLNGPLPDKHYLEDEVLLPSPPPPLSNSLPSLSLCRGCCVSSVAVCSPLFVSLSVCVCP